MSAVAYQDYYAKRNSNMFYQENMFPSAPLSFQKHSQNANHPTQGTGNILSANNYGDFHNFHNNVKPVPRSYQDCVLNDSKHYPYNPESRFVNNNNSLENYNPHFFKSSSHAHGSDQSFPSPYSNILGDSVRKCERRAPDFPPPAEHHRSHGPEMQLPDFRSKLSPQQFNDDVRSCAGGSPMGQQQTLNETQRPRGAGEVTPLQPEGSLSPLDSPEGEAKLQHSAVPNIFPWMQKFVATGTYPSFLISLPD